MATNDPVNSRSRSPGGGWHRSPAARRPARTFAIVATSVTLLVGAMSTAASAQDRPAGPAPLMATGQKDALPDKYIVVLRDSQPQQDMAARRTAAPAAALTRARTRGVQVRNEYRFALSGFSATLSASQLTDIRSDPDVAYVTADVQSRNAGIESDAPWGLDRIDQALPTLSGTYNYNGDGAGVTVFVVDGGIRATHQDFGGRVAAGVDFVGDGHGTDDCNGHGTNVASIIGGTKYGVAKAVTMVPVRVTDCNGVGSAANIVAAIDWVTGHHPGVTGLANMSVVLSRIIPAVDDAMTRSINSGVVWTLAAGNDNVDACTHSPTDTGGAITVGMVDRSGTRDPNSNFGGCLNMFAPGVAIPGAGIASDTATSLFTGTSQAAPHVAGVAAIYLQDRPNLPYWVIGRNLRAMGQSGVVSNAGAGSPNLLLSSRPLFGSSIALSRNNDSTLQMIGATTDGGLRWSNQTSISATTWTAPAAGGGTNTFALASSAGATTSDGWNIQFMLDIFGNIVYHFEGVNSPFWQRMDGSMVSVSAINQSNNRLLVIATDIQGRSWTREQAGTGRTAAWGGWQQFGTWDMALVSIERDTAGRLEAFGTNSAGQIFHRFQPSVGSAFTDWLLLPGTLVNVALARDPHGLLIAAGTNSAGQIFQAKQTSWGNWGPWNQIDGSLTQVTVRQRGDAMVEMFGVNGIDQIWHRWQTDTSGTWSNWVLLSGTLRG